MPAPLLGAKRSSAEEVAPYAGDARRENGLFPGSLNTAVSSEGYYCSAGVDGGERCPFNPLDPAMIAEAEAAVAFDCCEFGCPFIFSAMNVYRFAFAEELREFGYYEFRYVLLRSFDREYEFTESVRSDYYPAMRLAAAAAETGKGLIIE